MQAILFVSLVQLDHLSVVALGEGSHGGDIGDKQALFALHEISKHILVQINVLDNDGPQSLDILALAAVIPSFPRRPEANASLSISHIDEY